MVIFVHVHVHVGHYIIFVIVHFPQELRFSICADWVVTTLTSVGALSSHTCQIGSLCQWECGEILMENFPYTSL